MEGEQDVQGRWLVTWKTQTCRRKGRERVKRREMAGKWRYYLLGSCVAVFLGVFLSVPSISDLGSAHTLAREPDTVLAVPHRSR